MKPFTINPSTNGLSYIQHAEEAVGMYFKYRVALSSSNRFTTSFDYCRDNFGPDAISNPPEDRLLFLFDPSAAWTIIGKGFYFRDADDALAFEMVHA
jgi:hypothetical protein